MKIVNLNIERLIIHQVYRRNEDGDRLDPFRSHDLTRFDSDAMEEFRSRVIGALGESSKAVQMDIAEADLHRVPAIVDKLSAYNDHDFALLSYDVALRLSEAQNRRSMPGGIVVVFSGTYGVPAKKFVGIIKAEIHSAYEKELDKATNEISLKFVQEVLLTPSARLYKTAGFFEKPFYDGKSDDLNDKWAVMISDHQINQSDGKAAAKYFYSDFLGCCYQQTSARTTKQFFDATAAFIKDIDIPEEDKSELLNALTTYMKVDTSSTISATDFAGRYFRSAEVQDAFVEFIRDEGLPTTSFTKDITHIKNSLKYRKVSFGKSIKITASPEAFRDLIEMESIDGALDEWGVPASWTKIVIKERITEQE